MNASTVLDREEYIEQAYLFRVLRERMVEELAMQEVLEQVGQEILATTRLPYAVQFLTAEVKHSGLLSSGFTRLPHYFTPFQAFVVRCTEYERLRFTTETALLVLQREAEYRAGNPVPSGMFVYQFEVLCRNRLGYADGLAGMYGDPFYPLDWREFVDMVRQQVGLVDLSEMIYLRSEQYVSERRRHEPDYQPPLPAVFGAKEGKIAGANRGKDPLFLFAALQRQLNYPEVPRPRPRDDLSAKLEAMQARLRELDARLKLVESEQRGQVDLSQFGKPELLTDLPDDEE
ncbi:MAG TPA: hypothetical protein VMG10_21260 [Gemmataceae bacterium]|nr:hypothetical protein [Gemmataceae bacterium]